MSLNLDLLILYHTEKAVTNELHLALIKPCKDNFKQVSETIKHQGGKYEKHYPTLLRICSPCSAPILCLSQTLNLPLVTILGWVGLFLRHG